VTTLVSVEHEYVVYVETPGGPKDERHIYTCESELTERQVIDLGGRQVVIIEVVDRPGIGHMGLAEAEPIPVFPA
jgi:hypothetical protein